MTSVQYRVQVEFACVQGSQISGEIISHCHGDGEWETRVTGTGKFADNMTLRLGRRVGDEDHVYW